MSQEQTAKKSLGQHWLKDKNSLQAMIKAADIKPSDVVLEIGPGTGTLTDELIAAKAKVIALEYDKTLVKKLQQKYKNYPSTAIRIQEGDIRSYDFRSQPGAYKIVANIPYYLTANLMRILTDTPYKPDIAALLVQKEVAQRLAAKPGKMSQIAAITQLFYDVSLGKIVPAKLFTPPPKVDSQIVILKKYPQPLFENNQALIKLIKTGFASPRKTLVNNFSSGLKVDKATIEELFAKSDLTKTVRASELTLKNWHKLQKC